MAKVFPNHPNLIGGFAPIQMECDAADLVVDGEVPRDLNGTFYRNGPNPQFAPRGQHHWFGGDGMVHAFTVGDGRVAYRNRWARTLKWKTERDAHRAMVAAFNPMDCDPSVMGMQTDGIANTNIVWHAGKLLALEEAHAPFEMDPDTLDSIGAWTFDGKLVGPMTAHPKIDPETGEMVFFNQLQLHHVSCLERSVRESLLNTVGEERLPRNVYYRDGTSIEDAVMAEVDAVYQQAKVSFSWQEGDIMMLDNMLVAHGRNPFEGERKIVVALGEMFGEKDLEQLSAQVASG